MAGVTNECSHRGFHRHLVGPTMCFWLAGVAHDCAAGPTDPWSHRSSGHEWPDIDEEETENRDRERESQPKQDLEWPDMDEEHIEKQENERETGEAKVRSGWLADTDREETEKQGTALGYLIDCFLLFLDEV